MRARAVAGRNRALVDSVQRAPRRHGHQANDSDDDASITNAYRYSKVVRIIDLPPPYTGTAPGREDKGWKHHRDVGEWFRGYVHAASIRDGVKWLFLPQGIDEFAYVRKTEETLEQQLRLYEEIGSNAVYVPWLMYGSKRTRESLRGSVVASQTTRMDSFYHKLPPCDGCACSAHDEADVNHRYGDSYFVMPSEALLMTKRFVEIFDESFAVSSLWDPRLHYSLDPQQVVPEGNKVEIKTFTMVSNRYTYHSWEYWSSRCPSTLDPAKARHIFSEGAVYAPARAACCRWFAI